MIFYIARINHERLIVEARACGSARVNTTKNRGSARHAAAESDGKMRDVSSEHHGLRANP